MKHLLYSITEPVVCAKCADEVASGGTDAGSLWDYVKVDVGFTERGVQVWCRRHEVNVVHIDFHEARPNADFRCLERKSE